MLRTSEMENLRRNSLFLSHNHLPDVYFILYGTKDRTKKIYLNNYELKRKDFESSKERYFEFKSEDVGKITKLNLSVNENGSTFDCLYIDYIEVKIPLRSEAYKYMFQRILKKFFSSIFDLFSFKDFQLNEVLVNMSKTVDVNLIWKYGSIRKD